MAAIANTHDGVLVLGVDDKTRDIVGIPLDRLEDVERYVYEICNDLIKPPVFFDRFDCNSPTAPAICKRFSRWRLHAVCLFTGVLGDISFAKEVRERCRPNTWHGCFNSEASARLIRFEEQPVPQSSIDDLSEEL